MQKALCSFMLTLALINAGLFIGQPAQAAAVTMGETNILTNDDSGNANLLVAQKATLSQAATLQSLSFYVPIAAGKLRLGVYDSSGPSGGPGTKIAETAEMTPVVGWNTGNVLSPVTLSSGSYWLAYLTNNNGLYFRNTFNGFARAYSYSYGVMPNTFSLTPSNLDGLHWSLYASLNTDTGPDDIAPTVSISAPNNNSKVSGTSVTVSANASDNVSVAGVKFLLDGQILGTEDTTAPYSLTWNTTQATGGAHSLLAVARDLTGNIATSTSINITVDNQAPTGSVLINSGGLATNNRTVVLTLSASDAQSAVTQMRFSNTGSSYSTAEAFTISKTWSLTTGQGTKTVYVQFKDELGNWSPAFTDTISYDTTQPTISSVAVSGITNNSATISWITNEPATSQVEYGNTTAYGSLTALDTNLLTSHSMVLTGLTPSKLYNFRVKSTDAAGNQRLGSNTTFTTLAGQADTIAPIVPTNLTANPTSSSRIDLSWNASFDNIAVTGYKIFRNSAQVGTSVTTSYADQNLSPNTQYTYTVSAYDATGNNSPLSSSTSATTLPDTIAPTVSLTSPANGSTVSGSISVIASSNDNAAVAGVSFYADGILMGTEDTASPYTLSLDTRSMTDGPHTLYAIARDQAGNSATSSPVAILVDNTAPPTNMTVRYVNTASTAGGNGTTNATSGSDRAFASLLEAINSLPNVLTSPVTIYLDGAGGPDTQPVNQQPFDMVTTAENYLLITTNAANRATVPIDPNRYTLVATNTNALYNNIPSHIRIDGVQIQLNITNGSSYIGVKTSNANQTATDIDNRVSNTVVKCVVTSGNAIGFTTRFPDARANGNSYIWNSVAYDCTTGFDNDFVGAQYINNTSFNNNYGFIDEANRSLKVVNCLAAKGFKPASIGFIGSFSLDSDYNAEDDGNGVPGSHSRSLQTFSFIDPTNRNFRLSPSDTGAKDRGMSDPLNGKFSDDLDGTTRTTSWDIGADEVTP
jgi:hypothetical protein